MTLVVQKFGGTSLGSIEKIRHVANVVKKNLARQKCVVVVSAMAGQTNKLVQLSREISNQTHPEAYDMLLATGEQISCALLSMALRDLGVNALPLLAFQVGIQTDTLFTNARIQKINSDLLLKHLARGYVPVVAGFQGVDENGFITTLGRGGSDTSAVAISIAIKADRCDIFTDVDGVYTADPRYVPKAKKIEKITFTEMMELASLGAKVLHMRSVELAAKHKMPLRVLSTFAPEDSGTLLIQEEEMLESAVVSSITADTGQSLISITVSQKSGAAQYPAKFFRPLADGGIVVDVIIETPPNSEGMVNINFTVPRDDGIKAQKILSDYHPKIELENGVRISIVGIGMRSHSGVAAKMFETLGDLKIPIYLITTSEITVTVIVAEEHRQKALQGLHDAFNLG